MTEPIRSGAVVPIRSRSADPIRPAWDRPTADLPIVYSRGSARPIRGLVANLRPIARPIRRPAWRPDLWPCWIWAPLLCSPAVLVGFLIWAALALR